MNLSPRAWPSEARGVAAALVAALAFVAVLVAKRALLMSFVASRPWSGLLALAGFALAVEAARRGLRASPVPAWGAGAPLLALLFVAIMSTPMPYEMAHLAERLPHAEGTVRPTALETAPGFERGHPVAIAIFRYPPTRPLAELTEETREALAADGWSVTGVLPPEGEGADAYATVAATKRGFTVGCTLGTRGGWIDWDGPMRTVGCRLTV